MYEEHMNNNNIIPLYSMTFFFSNVDILFFSTIFFSYSFLDLELGFVACWVMLDPGQVNYVIRATQGRWFVPALKYLSIGACTYVWTCEWCVSKREREREREVSEREGRRSLPELLCDSILLFVFECPYLCIYAYFSLFLNTHCCMP